MGFHLEPGVETLGGGPRTPKPEREPEILVIVRDTGIGLGNR
jgi:hypothetical protein